MQPTIARQNRALEGKYRVTAWFYDLLDLPWERQYRKWRPDIVGDASGRVLEAGVGTGRNLAHYGPQAHVTAIDLSAAMLKRAARRAAQARTTSGLDIELCQADATNLARFSDATFDWVISTFMCCVMPDELQPQAISEMARVLKPGGHFRLLEMVYSRDAKLRRRQRLFAPFVEKVYGARFDRQTSAYLEHHPRLEVTSKRFLKADTYLLIEGRRR